MKGQLHSIQSLGAVDGPGLRSVAFTQGCPLRCAYCHNPDTWDPAGGWEISPEALCERLLRFRPYWGKTGGVTVSGGEPLWQAEFVAELFILLHKAGVHTALDTSGAASLDRAEKVLQHTDLVLADVKFLSEKDYQALSGGSFAHTKSFLDLTKRMRVPLWVRHVVVPGLTDDIGHLKRMRDFCRGFPNLEKIEWLPFQKLCLEKYQRMGAAFPLESVPAMEPRELDCRLRAI